MGVRVASTADDRQTRVEAADQDWFTGLYERHCHAVYNHCFRRTGSWSLAEEMTAATFLLAWRRRSTVPLDLGELPWLLAVANNVLRNVRRTQRRMAALLARLPTPEPVPDPAGRVEARVDAERQMTALLPVLGRLPMRERVVIELCAGAGLTHAEAAAALGVPVGTVKSRLARGLARLRAELDKDERVRK
jgi:RNA polymerase sigma-70 factor, ECF subfamily